MDKKLKIDWKSRFKNKAWVLAFLTTVVAFAYQILGMFGIVPAVSEDLLMQAITAFLNILVAIGVIMEPTTPGISDGEKK